MIKTIAILGSTGSIGKTLLNIIKKDKKNFEVKLLTANKNYKLLLKQAKFFNVKNLVITDKKVFKKISNMSDHKNYNFYNNFNELQKILKKKISYTMSAITGLDGLAPTLKIIKYSKTIAIANKESIICGWNLIDKEIKLNKCNFIPVDSEHFSIWYGLNGIDKKNIQKIYLTASGGPFLNIKKNKINKIKIADAINHPNWKMGKKISIDSATMMNKVFEIIEAKKIFNLPIAKLSILVHPKSYIHAILKLNNGLIKIIAHETSMKVPISNSLFNNSIPNLAIKKLQIDILNNLKLSEINLDKFPVCNILNKIPKKNSLFETVLVSANDQLVNLYMQSKIKFTDISLYLLKIINLKKFIKFKNRSPLNINEILSLSEYVRFHINRICV